jgi:hypothetical protein
LYAGVDENMKNGEIGAPYPESELFNNTSLLQTPIEGSK